MIYNLLKALVASTFLTGQSLAQEAAGQTQAVRASKWTETCSKDIGNIQDNVTKINFSTDLAFACQKLSLQNNAKKMMVFTQSVAEKEGNSYIQRIVIENELQMGFFDLAELGASSIKDTRDKSLSYTSIECAYIIKGDKEKSLEFAERAQLLAGGNPWLLAEISAWEADKGALENATETVEKATAAVFKEVNSKKKYRAISQISSAWSKIGNVDNAENELKRIPLEYADERLAALASLAEAHLKMHTPASIAQVDKILARIPSSVYRDKIFVDKYSLEYNEKDIVDQMLSLPQDRAWNIAVKAIVEKQLGLQRVGDTERIAPAIKDFQTWIFVKLIVGEWYGQKGDEAGADRVCVEIKGRREAAKNPSFEIRVAGALAIISASLGKVDGVNQIVLQKNFIDPYYEIELIRHVGYLLSFKLSDEALVTWIESLEKPEWRAAAALGVLDNLLGKKCPIPQ